MDALTPHDLFLTRIVPAHRDGVAGQVEDFAEAPCFRRIVVRRREVERGLFFGHALDFHGSPAAHFEVRAVAFVFAFGAVQHVNAKFGGHVQAVVRAGGDAQLARRAGLPNHANAAVVVARDEEPRLHVLKALIRVQDGLRAPHGGHEVAGFTVGRVLVGVLRHVVERDVGLNTGLAAFVQHLRCQGVVVAP